MLQTCSKAKPCIPPDEDSLEWWKNHELQYPNLARYAMCVLAIPGMSVPSERLVSTAEDIVNCHRASLTS